MNSGQPRPGPGQEKRQNARRGEALSDSSACGAVPCPAVRDATHNTLAEHDPAGAFLHQLSQLLTALHGTLELALLADGDAQGYRKALQQSLVQAEGLIRLFRSYRAASRGGNGGSGE